MTDPYLPITQLLDALEATLRHQGLWEGAPPVPEAFDSAMPFFADRMAYTAWLQWVFIARMRALIAAGLPLPDNCMIAPMAEEALPAVDDRGQILHLLAKLDVTISRFDANTP